MIMASASRNAKPGSLFGRNRRLRFLPVRRVFHSPKKALASISAASKTSTVKAKLKKIASLTTPLTS
jgi:hypothetical protein